MSNIVGSFEAKTHFSQLIERVVRGEEIIITKRGLPVAKLTAIDNSMKIAKAGSAVERIQNLAKRLNLGDLSFDDIKKYRDEGKK